MEKMTHTLMQELFKFLCLYTECSYAKIEYISQGPSNTKDPELMRKCRMFALVIVLFIYFNFMVNKLDYIKLLIKLLNMEIW
jgi:hypothetical protein